MHNPPHPGGVFKRQLLDPKNVSVIQAAERLGINKSFLYKMIRGKVGISVSLSERIAKEFDSSPELWRGMQLAYDEFKKHN